MIRKTFLILSLFISLSLPVQASIFDSLLPSDNNENEGQEVLFEGKTFFSTLSEIKKIKQKISELDIDIKFLKDPSAVPVIAKLEEKYEEKESLENIIKNSEDSLEDALKEDLEEDLRVLEDEILALEAQKKEALKANHEELYNKELELNQATSLLEKNRELSKNFFMDYLKRALIYFLLILFTIIFAYFAKKAVRKNKKNLSQTRQTMLIKFIKVGQAVVILFVLLSLFFSEFVTLIPILALIGTGLAFAVRDVILSLLAWFFIGTNKRFKLNDLIEIGDAKGRVLDITLLHTTLKETGEKGPSGRLISFPNKKIFEESLHNFSAMYQFMWIIIDFYLETGSNTHLVKRKMLESINEVAEEDLAEVQKNLPSLAQSFGLNEETAKPQVYMDLEEKGIHVKAKFLSRLVNRHILKTKVSERFLSKIKDDHDIKIRFLMF
jgi:small-conductance mechanosensitive channel